MTTFSGSISQPAPLLVVFRTHLGQITGGRRRAQRHLLMGPLGLLLYLALGYFSSGPSPEPSKISELG